MSVETLLPATNLETQPEAFSYQLLQGHNTTTGSWKSTEQLQTEYIRLTDDIVHKLTDGVDIFNKKTGIYETVPVDFVVWIDKSARPVSWLTKELWPALAKDAEGNIPERPPFKYVNIDRNQWISSIDPQGVGNTDVASIDPTVVRSLRSIFLKNPEDRSKGLTEEIDTAPTLFDDKTILIIDEVMSSGRTLSYSKSFFKRAFPSARVAGTHWMADTVMVDGAIGNADLPVWYSDKTSKGRGVDNRNVDLSRTSNSQAQRLGAWFLSVAPSGYDPLSQQLRDEVKHLAKDATIGKVLIEPSRERDLRDYEERALRLNNAEDFETFLKRRKSL